MTALQRWRKVAQRLIIVSFTGEAAVTIVGLAVLRFVAVQGGEALAFDRLVPGVVTLGIYGVAIWAVRDARRRRRPGGTGDNA